MLSLAVSVTSCQDMEWCLIFHAPYFLVCAEAKLHKLLKHINSIHDWPMARQVWCNQSSVECQGRKKKKKNLREILISGYKL